MQVTERRKVRWPSARKVLDTISRAKNKQERGSGDVLQNPKPASLQEREIALQQPGVPPRPQRVSSFGTAGKALIAGAQNHPLSSISEFRHLSTRRRALTLPGAAGGIVEQPTLSLWFRLPPNLRRVIYSHALGGNIIHIIRKGDKISHKRCTSGGRPDECMLNHCRGRKTADGFHDVTGDSGLLPILQTCREIYSEAINTLYAANTFNFDSLEALIEFSCIIRGCRLDAIRRLQLDFHFDQAERFAESTPQNDWHRWERAWRIIGSMVALESIRLLISWRNTSRDENRETQILEPLWLASHLKTFDVCMPLLQQVSLRNRVILVGGSAFQITTNLEGAIRSLQSDEESVTIWADAICINQSDKEEKGDQVQQMRDIYEGALDVVIWLGPSSHDSDMGMDTLAHYGKEAADMDLHHISTMDVNNWTKHNATALSNRSRKFVHEMATTHGLELPTAGIQGIFSRQWFQRVWILQEVSVARNPVFVCGKKRISMSHLTAAIFFYIIYVTAMLEPLQKGKILGPEERSKDQTFLGKLDTATAGTVIGGRRKYKGELGGPESLFQLLYRTNVVSSSLKRLQATVDKDRVYALLGISKDASELGIRPDYTKTCQRVYIDTAATLLEHGHLDILALRQFPEKYPELPSWVPDWTAQIHAPCGGLQQAAIYKACGKTEHSVIISSLANDLDIAAITGSVIDKVTDVGVPWLPVPQAPNFDWAACSLLLSEIEAFCKESNRLGHDIYNEPRQRIEAVCRTPFADQRFLNITGICRASSDGKEILDDYKLINEIASLSQKAPDNIAPNTVMGTWRSQTVMGGMFNRRPFISALGYVGLAPSHSEPGDTLCIFHGTIVPYVIRKGEHGRYRLVGEAYVHGIMDGEFIKRNPPVETFELY